MRLRRYLKKKKKDKLKPTELSLHKDLWRHKVIEITYQKFSFKGQKYHCGSSILLTLLFNIDVSCVSCHDHSHILPFWLIVD